jgi:hypothetical protein
MNGRLQTRRVETVHCLILGLSMFLVGLYFGTSLPAGVDLVVLQTGLIGFLGFMGLTQIRVATESQRHSQIETTISRSKQVERRLDRHTAKREIRIASDPSQPKQIEQHVDRHTTEHDIQRIDRGKHEGRPVSVRKSSRTAGAVSAVTESERGSILD